MELVVAFNHAVREADEWFDEPDDLERVQRVLNATQSVDDPVLAAAMLARKNSTSWNNIRARSMRYKFSGGARL